MKVGVAASLLLFTAAHAVRADGISALDFEEATAIIDPTTACTPEPPHFPPAGYSLASALPLDEIWRATTGYAIGSALAQIRVATGTYQSHAFERAMFPDGEVHVVNGDTSNLGPAAVGASVRYIAISHCVGDLRPPVSGGDPLRGRECRVYANEGPFLYLNFGAARAGMCTLDPAEVYVLNVVLDDPVDGYDPSVPCNAQFPFRMCGFRISVTPGD